MLCFLIYQFLIVFSAAHLVPLNVQWQQRGVKSSSETFPFTRKKKDWGKK